MGWLDHLDGKHGSNINMPFMIMLRSSVLACPAPSSLLFAGTLWPVV
jgi:hypothetical protein